MRQATLKALLLDMDGTLADTDPFHQRSFVEFLAPYGIAVDDEVYRAKISGRTNALIFADLFPDRTPDDHRRLSDEKEALFRAGSAALEPVAGLGAFVDLARDRGLRLGLVTNGPRANVDHILAALGLASRFTVTVAGEDVTRGKPDPLPYLTALDRLGVGPGEAIAFEDSPAGLKAAKAAELFTVGILTGHDAATLSGVGADLTARDFSDPAVLALLAEPSRA